MIETCAATLFVINPDQQTPAEKAKVAAWRQAYTAFPQRFVVGSSEGLLAQPADLLDSQEG